MKRSYNLKKGATPDLGSLFREVKDRVDVEQVVDNFGLVKKLNLQLMGSEFKGMCPTGHQSSSGQSFNLSKDDGLYHCWSCGIGGDIIGLVSVTNNTGYKEAARLIAEKLAPDLVSGFSAADEAISTEETEVHERGFLYRLVFEKGKQQMLEPIAKPVMDYLTVERGYDATKIPATEWIYWDTETNIRNYLEKTVPAKKDQIAQLHLNGGFGDIFRLALPFRDQHGVIRGFLKRALKRDGFLVDGKLQRWDSTTGLKKAAIFGLNRIRKQTEVIIVEGYPDAAYLPAAGLPNIVALGQAAFSEKYIGGLESLGVKRLILALDNDGGTGIKNSESICQLFAGTDISVFVVDPPAMGAHKDPDEYVKANGPDDFKQLVQAAESSSRWMTKRILAKHDLTQDLGRERAIREGLEYADALDNPRQAEDVLKGLTAKLALTDEVLAEEYGKLQEEKARVELKEGIRTVSRNAEMLIADGDTEKAVRVVQEGMAEVQADFWRAKEPAKMSLIDFMTEKKAKDSQRTAGQRIGYELKDFKEIDVEILGLQTGLYVIAADPNVGKTALMVSLTIDLLRSNDKAACLFYSMDDSREMIVNRMLAHLSDLRINEVRFKLTDAKKQAVLEESYKQMNIWAQTSRLEIRESSAYLTMNRIENEIRQHKGLDDLIVLIDGLYNVPVESDYGSIREENIDRANQVKRLVRLFDLPVLATAEFRKQGRDESTQKQRERTIHDIMETGKYGYNADLAILLSPKDPDAYASENEPIIVADFGKNKLESFRGKMEFKFIRAKSVMTPVPGTKTQP
jgi:DNA primase catalytic core